MRGVHTRNRSVTRNTRGGVGGVGQKMRTAADDRRTAVVAAVGARRQQPVEDTIRCCREEADGGVLQVTSTPFSVSLSPRAGARQQTGRVSPAHDVTAVRLVCKNNARPCVPVF